MPVTAAELASFTGRPVDDPNVAEAVPVSLAVLQEWYEVPADEEDFGEVEQLAQKHIGRWLLQARQGELVDGGDLGTVYLPHRLPAVERLVGRKGGIA